MKNRRMYRFLASRLPAVVQMKQQCRTPQQACSRCSEPSTNHQLPLILDMAQPMNWFQGMRIQEIQTIVNIILIYISITQNLYKIVFQHYIEMFLTEKLHANVTSRFEI